MIVALLCYHMIGFLTQDGSPCRGSKIPATGATSLPAVSEEATSDKPGSLIAEFLIGDPEEGPSAISPQPAADDEAASLPDAGALEAAVVQSPAVEPACVSPSGAELEACLGDLCKIGAIEEKVLHWKYKTNSHNRNPAYQDAIMK